MKVAASLLGTALGAGLAVTSVWTLAQGAPESILPPGFDKPAAPARDRTPKPAKPPAPAPVRPSIPDRPAERPADRPGAAPAPAAPATPVAASTSVPVIQPLPGTVAAGQSAPRAPAPGNFPALADLEKLPADQLDELLGLKPKFDIPAAARRSLSQVGILGTAEGGFAPASLAAQPAALVRAAIAGTKGPVVSRWGHILLRRALASRLDAPRGMDGVEFAALRTGLLVRLGEGRTARALAQDVDGANYSPALTQAALDAYTASADPVGICPVAALQGGARKDGQWQVVRAICAAFSGESSSAMAQLDRATYRGAMPRIDMLLAQKFAGAGGNARRAVTIEWDGVKTMTPWRYALSIATGLTPPAALLKDAPPAYDYTAATAPMLGLAARAAAADRAAAAGVVSSAAMVDLYSQIFAADDVDAVWSGRSDKLRDAYVAGDPAARMAAIKALWDDTATPDARYARQVLTAYASARLPVDSSFSGDAGGLVTAMLGAGLDRNALAWAGTVASGSLGWAQLALAAPVRSNPIPGSAVDDFRGDDTSPQLRKTRFLLAGLAGLGRIDEGAVRSLSAKLDIDLGRQTRWTRLIDQAAAVDNPALVALLAGTGMQGSGWDKMTSVNLFHIVGALNRVGLGAEARMIAAEAVARG